MTKNDGFITIGLNRGTAAHFSRLTKPSVRFSKYMLYMHEDIYVELGSPPQVLFSINPGAKLIKLEGVDPASGVDLKGVRSYKVKEVPYPDGGKYYQLRTPTDPSSRAFINSMDTGFYTSIGGGVYKFHGPKPPIK